MRVSHDSYANMIPSLAELDGVSVDEYEGKLALKIMDNAPCLSSSSGR